MIDIRNDDEYWDLRSFDYCHTNPTIENEKKGYYTAICYNQNGFKKFLMDLDTKGYLLANTQEAVCYSEERYPSSYPCTVQIWHHFEGSMVYVDIKYYVPIQKLSNYSGEVIVFKTNKKYYMFLSDEKTEPEIKDSIEITKDMFLHFVEKSKDD